MLQNEPQSEPLAPTGQIRITPDELSRAVAAIESRKQAEAQRIAGTIPIEEAVSQLHLDATSEEVWAEVQAQRDKEAKAQQESFAEAEAARRAQVRQAPFVQPSAQVQEPSRARRRGWVGILPPILIAWVLYTTGVIPHFWQHKSFPPAVMTALSQVPDGQDVYCDTSTLVQISEGKSLPQAVVDKNSAQNNLWTVFKMRGHVYLRGYTLPLSSIQAAQGKPLEVYNDDNSGALEGEKTAITTLPIDNVSVQKSGGDDDYSEITVNNFQPDPLTTTTEWR